MSDNQVLTNAQAAEYIGITATTLRSWKSRKADLFTEGIHWINQDNQVLWTQAGLEVLQSIKGATDSVTDDVTDPLQKPLDAVTEGVTDPLQRYTGFVEAVANGIAPGLLHRIDNAVTRKVKQAIATPMSPAECVTLLTELGLKPCNPELLLSGNQTNLLTESKEN